MHFTARHREILEAICNAFIPSVEKNIPDHAEIQSFWKRKAGDLKVAEKILELLGREEDYIRKEFVQALELFDNRWMLFFTSGYFSGFDRLSQQQQESILQKYALSRIPALRQVFGALKKLTSFIYYTICTETEANPNWSAMRYPGALDVPPLIERSIKPLEPTRNVILECDVLVIGSGAGGGVVAGELAEAGHKVIVVEKGGYFAEDAFTQREMEMVAALYENGGLLTTRDGAVNMYAGSCLGGGTTVNWTGAIRTPDHILEEWAKEAQLPHLLTAEYQQGFDSVMQQTNVSTDETIHNLQNQALWDGSVKQGHLLKLMPRNVKGCCSKDCRPCGYCTMGCQYGHKQSTVKTYLQKVFDLGGDILVNTEIEKIIIESGRATGAIGKYTHRSGKVFSITVKAKKVVAAAGALHTPALLLRSGLSHPAIGKHLYLHPTVGVSARYSREMTPWFGTMMSAINDEFNHLTGNFGVKLETPPLHTGMIAAGTPWTSAQQHKEMMLDASRLATFIVLTRDRDGGRVTLSPQGKPVFHYRLSSFDRSHLLRGVEEAMKIHLQAGAEVTYLPHHALKGYTQREKDRIRRDLKTQRWEPNAFSLFSAHQMGTCRMGGNARTHAVSPAGETYEVKQLYVADASLFPRSSGVNPMLSIQGMSHWVARNLK